MLNFANTVLAGMDGTMIPILIIFLFFMKELSNQENFQQVR